MKLGASSVPRELDREICPPLSQSAHMSNAFADCRVTALVDSDPVAQVAGLGQFQMAVALGTVHDTLCISYAIHYFNTSRCQVIEAKRLSWDR